MGDHDCISIVLMTFRRSSSVYFVKSNESRISKGLGFTPLSLLLGWRGIPWGPFYTIGALITNFGGGKDVTEEIMAAIVQSQAQAAGGA
mgnify:CR=1 FL=1